MDDIRIVLTRPLPFGAMEKFPAGWDVRAAGAKGPLDRGALMTILPGRQGLLCQLTDTIDAPIIDAGPDLRIIANVGVGFNNIDWQHARRKGIVVTNTPGALTEATADLTLALVLACARRLLEADRFLRRGKFEGWDLELMLGLELSGATLGIIGMGRIGQAVARRANAFGMKVLYTNRRALPAEIERDLTARRVDLDELLGLADVISIHCPSTPDTRHLIGAEALRKMKDGAILVNTSRGPVVDEEALLRALLSGKLRAAGLDVYEREPAVHPGLIALENVILLPHIGSATAKTRQAIVQMAIDNLTAFFGGGQALNPVF